MSGRSGGIAERPRVAEHAREVTLAHERGLPISGALESLLPGGLRRGSVVTVDGSTGHGATSLALALAAGPSAAGAWTALVGFGSLGPLAAVELGLALERLVFVGPPASASTASVATASTGVAGSLGGVVAALVDAFDVVLLDGRQRLRAGDARRLVARTRARGAVLVQAGATWSEGVDVHLTITGPQWQGLGRGHGHLQARRVMVEANGRRGASQARRVRLWLPGPDGTVSVAATPGRLRMASDMTGDTTSDAGGTARREAS